MYNYLLFDGECPRCHKIMSFKAEFKFGYLNLDTYRVGERINQDKEIQKNIGKIIENGYVECEDCQKDFLIDIIIENSIITCVMVNNKIKGYIK